MDGESLEDSAREMAELKGKLLEQQAAMREALSAMAVGFRRQLRQRHELQVQTEYFLATLVVFYYQEKNMKPTLIHPKVGNMGIEISVTTIEE